VFNILVKSYQGPGPRKQAPNLEQSISLFAIEITLSEARMVPKKKVTDMIRISK